MDEGTKCGSGNLNDIVYEFIERIRDHLESKCIKDVSTNDLMRELQALTPLLRTVLSKWVPEIIYTLYIKGGTNFNELKRILSISSRVLSDKLEILEEKGIVTRNIDSKSKPPKVRYGLTSLGRELGLALVPLLTVIKRELSSEL